MSATNAPPRSPPRPPSASTSASTTTSSTSLRSTIYPSSSGGGGGGGGDRRGVDDGMGWGGASTTASSSVSASQFPLPPGHFQQQHFAQQHSHQLQHRHHGGPLPQQQQQQQQHHQPPHVRRQITSAPPLHLEESTHNPPPISSSSTNTLPPSLHSPTNPAHLPTPLQASQTAQARDALVASLGNALDTELSSRASLLHANQAAIEKQERDVQTALGAFRKENDKLAKVLADGSRQVKELGDVQNWAEKLERDFLVLEETMRLVQRGEGEEGSSCGGGSYTGSESGSWSGSEDGGQTEGEGEQHSQHKSGPEHHEDQPGEDSHMADVHDDTEAARSPADLSIQPTGKDKGKGKAKELNGDETSIAARGDAMDMETEESHRPAGALAWNTTETSSGIHHDSATAPPQATAGVGWLRRLTWRGT